MWMLSWGLLFFFWLENQVPKRINFNKHFEILIWYSYPVSNNSFFIPSKIVSYVDRVFVHFFIINEVLI